MNNDSVITNTSSLTELLNICDKNNILFSTTIELLTKCNWKCKHCYIPNHDNIGLSKSTIFNIFSQLRELGTFEIILTGGEIFYRKDIMDIIEKARQMHFKITLLSNVSLMNEEIISKLSRLSIYNISCTIFSLDESIHDSITRIPGSLKKALSNIMLIKKYNIPLEIKTIIMKENYNSYKQLKDFCSKNGFEYSATPIITAKHNGDKSPLKLRLSENQLEEVFLSTDDMNKINKRHISKDDYACNTIRYSLSIGANGNIYPCNTFITPIGNVYEDNLKNIWNTSTQLFRIKSLKWKDLSICSSCNKIDYCYRCPGISLLEDNNILSKSSLACQHANIRHKLYCKKGE